MYHWGSVQETPAWWQVEKWFCPKRLKRSVNNEIQIFSPRVQILLWLQRQPKAFLRGTVEWGEEPPSYVGVSFVPAIFNPSTSLYHNFQWIVKKYTPTDKKIPFPLSSIVYFSCHRWGRQALPGSRATTETTSTPSSRLLLGNRQLCKFLILNINNNISINSDLKRLYKNQWRFSFIRNPLVPCDAITIPLVNLLPWQESQVFS